MKSAIEAGNEADAMIAKEIAGQDSMWGDLNERTDVSNGQLLKAGLAQGLAVAARRDLGDPITHEDVPTIYPADWSGFRNYGADIPNLVVLAAFVRQEIKRLVLAGEDSRRLSRDEAHAGGYKYDQPAQPFPTGS